MICGYTREDVFFGWNQFLCGIGNDDNGFPGVIGAKASLVSKLFIYRRQSIPSNSIQSNHYYCRV